MLEETIGRIQAAEAKAAAAEVEALRRRAAEKEPDVVDAVLRALVWAPHPFRFQNFQKRRCWIWQYVRCSA